MSWHSKGVSKGKSLQVSKVCECAASAVMDQTVSYIDTHMLDVQYLG